MSTSLTEEQMRETMTKIMSGQFAETDIENFLIDLSVRGETVAEITGAAKVLRANAKPVNAPPGTVDCCGTGGDLSGTYNISTAVAIVAAACGVPVAKHGNRASSSKSGAADVLEALGANLDLDNGQIETALKKFNFAFLMAPHHHTAMKHVSAARKKVGSKTIFNVLGPLANPANTKLQLVGVYSKKLVRPITEVLKNLGTERAWVVHGSDGLDEITVTGPTSIAILDNGKITEKEITPADFGLPVSNAADLKGGDAAHNAAAMKALLEGQKSPFRDIVLANAAAVLIIHGDAWDMNDGVHKAAAAIDNGLAFKTLSDYIEFTKS